MHRIWKYIKATLLGGILFLLVTLLLFVIVFVKYFKIWLQAYVTRSRVSILSLIAMTFRKVNARARSSKAPSRTLRRWSAVVRSFASISCARSMTDM